MTADLYKQQFVEQLRKADKRIPESDLFDLVSDRREYPTGWKQSTGLFLRQLALPPPFRGTLFHKKTEIPEGVSQILGASVLIGLFKKHCHTNGFSDFRATNFPVLTS